MRMLVLEIKRVLKTRSTLLLAAAAVMLSAFLAVNVIRGERIYDRDYNIVYSGMDAIQKGHEIDAPYEGQILPEKLLEANERYCALSAQYGGAENIPEKEYRQHIWGLREYINLVGAITNDPETGYTLEPEKRTSEDVLSFYQNREDFVTQKLAEKELRGDDVGQANAQKINASVDTPFIYYSYRGWGNGGENIAILVFLIAIVCATITAPVFASEYQTGSDQILRGTKHGRARLGTIKLLSAILISLLLFAICIALILGILYITLGANGLKTSVQMMLPTAIAPLTLGGVNTLTIVSGALTLIATVCFTLFLSARSRAPITALIVSIVVILLPSIMRALVGGNLAQWIRFCLPSGGTGFGNSIYYELLYTATFLRAGGASIWSPYVIVIAAAVNIVIFGLLAVRAYSRHEVA